MALLRYSPDLDPVTNLIALQGDLERFLRNPGLWTRRVRLGRFSAGKHFRCRRRNRRDRRGAGHRPESISVSGQGHTLTIKGERRRETSTEAAAITAASDRSASSRVRSSCRSSSISTRRPPAYDAGVLTVKVSKAEAAKPRQIAVKSA